MNVYVLSGSVGTSRCHIEVFEDSDEGLLRAKKRRIELTAMNPSWRLDIEKQLVQ